MGGLESIDPRLAEVWTQACGVLGSDDRVEAVELRGSVASGSADEWSDLDTAVFVRDEALDGFLADRAKWLASITNTVFAGTALSPSIINCVTRDGLGFDILVQSRGTDGGVLPGPERIAAPAAGSPAALEAAVLERLRGLTGPFISMVMRGEHYAHFSAVSYHVGLLNAVLSAEVGSRLVGKRWNATLTADQRAAVASLPAVAPERESLIEFEIAVSEMMLTRARPLFAKFDLPWPTDFAQTVSRRLSETLGLETVSWLR